MNRKTPPPPPLRSSLLPLFLLGFLWAVPSQAEPASGTGLGETEVIQIWPDDSGMNDPGPKEGLRKPRGDGHVRVTNVATPSMLYFPAPESDDPTPAVILCPGGGYKHLVVTKMTPTAEWLNEQGISAFVLKYRTPKKRADAFKDLQRAIRTVRARSEEWNIDPDRIGVMGSSAGGHLAARVSTDPDAEAYPPVDSIDEVSARPDFTVLLYPAYMNKRKGDELSDDFEVSADLPPTLILSARDDTKFFRGSEVYAAALEEAGAPVQTHFFEKGGHGFELIGSDPPLDSLPALLREWLVDVDVLQPEPETVVIDGEVIEITPKKFEPTLRNVAYGPHERNKLDFWKAESDEPTPLVFYIHGGGWRGGSKESNSGPYLNLLDDGVSYVSINYRLIRENNKLPSSLHDAARALQFVRSKADEWNIDPDRIIATGGSAGGCSSLWLAFHDDLADPESDDSVERESTRVEGAAVIMAQTTIDPRIIDPRIGPTASEHPMIWDSVGASSLEDLLANWEKYEDLSLESSPLTHLSPDDPPVLLIYSEDAPAPAKENGIHHVEFGRILQEQAKPIGLDYEIEFAGKDTRQEILDGFMLKRFQELE